ncbi:YkvI family membrane protein [Alcaligenes aquatilis]|uniref:YkvI family membrane protein n=1 Tax=Alcaligenes aquatilis TaxID=323284 RepID=UPI003F8DAD31
MSNIRNILGIAMAFVGVVVGAGFASGQEVLQFFSSFGYWGLLGGVVSGLCFTILGMAVGELSQVSVSHSFKEGLYLICGPRLGVVVDIMITFFMYAIAVVMFAGGGSLMEQQWGVPAQYGSVAVMLITVLIVFLRVDRVMAFIGSVTPILVLMMVFLCIYSWNTRDLPLEELDIIAHTKPQGAGHWLVGALLYVSYNMVVGAPFLMIAGAQATSRRNALLGGLVGGLLLGFLIVLISAGVFGRIDTIGSAALPMLMLATEQSRLLGTIMSVVVFAMILTTSVGVLYSFSARIFTPNTRKFNIGTAIAGVLGLVGAKIGFINLVGTVYPFFGYLGFVLMAWILIAWFRLRRLQSRNAT